MYYPITARRFWSSLAGAACLALAGCGPRQGTTVAPEQVTLWCTFSGEAQARVLREALAAGTGWKIVVLPLAAPDLLAGLEGTRAGDLAVFPEATLLDDLASRGLARGEALRYDLGFYVLSRAPVALADLAVPGRRLGGLPVAGGLDAALVAVLPSDLRAPITANIRHRSARADELIRLVRQDALDAAIVWAPPPAGAALEVLSVGGGDACCPLLAQPLSCSKLSSAQWEAVLAVCRDPAVVQALQERPGGRKGGAP